MPNNPYILRRNEVPSIETVSPMKDERQKLVERLRREYTRIPGTGTRLINPDGPEAAKRIEELEAGLKPFAEDGSLYVAHVPDSLVPTIFCEETGIKSPACFTVGDLRRARTLIGDKS